MTNHARGLTLGIDFGTSNSAVSMREGLGPARLLALEGEHGYLPTALFFSTEDHRTYYGREAVAQYLSGTEGRLLRSLKSLLGSRLIDEHTAVGGRLLSFKDIIGRYLQELARRAREQLGQDVQRVVIGRPVHFVDEDADRDAQAERALAEAAALAGFTDVSFELEPIAAAFDYERRLQHEQLVLVADIGGGTSDFSVVRLGPGRAEHADRSGDVLSTAGVHIGGTDFDRKLSLEQVMPLLGFRHTDARGREVPSAVFFELATWHLIHWLYTPTRLREAANLHDSYADTRLHERLLRVLQKRLGHWLAGVVEEAKIRCAQGSVQSAMRLEEVEPGLIATLEAADLERHLGDMLDKVCDSAAQCVQKAGLQGRLPDAIYLTGGSSALPPFQRALQQRFLGVPLIEGDRFGGVALGLAYAGTSRRA